MFLLKEKQRIRRGMTKRATTTRARQILAEKYNIVLQGEAGRRELWEWLNYDSRDNLHAEEFAAAYLQAIAERNEKVNLLVKPQRERAIESAKRLVSAQ